MPNASIINSDDLKNILPCVCGEIPEIKTYEKIFQIGHCQCLCDWPYVAYGYNLSETIDKWNNDIKKFGNNYDWKRRKNKKLLEEQNG